MFTELCEILRELDYEPQSYSGRGMYGDTCLSITCEDVGEAMLHIGYNIAKKPNCSRLFEKMKKYKWDSLGRKYVIYYPNIDWEEEEEEENS